MKVLLISPPWRNENIGNYPCIIEEERGQISSFYLLCFSGYLNKRKQYYKSF
jgi:hypothetical protein